MTKDILDVREKINRIISDKTTLEESFGTKGMVAGIVAGTTCALFFNAALIPFLVVSIGPAIAGYIKDQSDMMFIKKKLKNKISPLLSDVEKLIYKHDLPNAWTYRYGIKPGLKHHTYVVTMSYGSLNPRKRNTHFKKMNLDKFFVHCPATGTDNRYYPFFEIRIEVAFNPSIGNPKPIAKDQSTLDFDVSYSLIFVHLPGKTPTIVDSLTQVKQYIVKPGNDIEMIKNRINFLLNAIRNVDAFGAYGGMRSALINGSGSALPFDLNLWQSEESPDERR